MDRMRAARRDEEGFTLVEVVVAMALFAVLSTAVLAGIDAAQRMTRTNEHRATAASLAARVLEAAAVADPTTLPGPTASDPGWTADPAAAGAHMKTITTGGVAYVARRSVSFLQQAGAPGRCGVGPSRNVAMQVHVSVDWPGRPSGVGRVAASSIRAVDLNAVAPTTGTLAVAVEDKGGVAQSGVTVTLTPGPVTATTDTAGCAVFPSLAPRGDYAVKLTRTGFQDPLGVAEPVRSYIAVTRGELSEEYFTYSSPDAPPAPPTGLSVTGSCLSAASPTFRAATQNGVTSGSTLVLTTPAGVQVGDLLVALVSTNDQTNPGTPPSGWTTAITTLGSSNPRISARVAYRFAEVGDPSSWTWTLPGTSGAGGIAAYSGVLRSTPIGTSAGGIDQSGSGLVSTPTISAGANTALLAFLTQSSTGASWTPQGGMTEHVDVAASGGGVSVEVAGQPISAAASVFRSATSTNNGKGIGQILTLNGVPQPGATLSWTSSPSTYADGYRLLRIRSSVTEREQFISGRSTTTVTDGPLVAGATYTFDLAATAGSTVSSSVQATFTATAC